MNYGGMFWQIAQYPSERGFAVLRYDKRGIGENGTIINNNVWGNMTYNDLVQDAQKALNVLIHQPEVNPNKISIIGHSEGGETVTRIAIDNPATKIKNIMLLDARIQDAYDSVYYQFVGLPLEYAKEVLDKNHTESISIQKAVQDPLFGRYIAFSLAGNQNYSTNATTNSTDLGTLSSTLFSENSNGINTTIRQGAGSAAVGLINIDKQLKPMLERTFESAIKATIREIHSKCETLTLCPTYVTSFLNLNSTLSIIGNVPSYTGILMLHGQNDSASPVQQAFLLQQRLTELNHPDHTLITYPNLGHRLYPSSQWQTSSGPVPSYVLADLYAWLESHSGFTRSPSLMPSSYSSSYSSSTNSTGT